jgi:hypothetical protein
VHDHSAVVSPGVDKTGVRAVGLRRLLMTERRRHHRTTPTVLVKAKLDVAEVCLVNISLGGLMLYADRPFQIGAVLPLRVDTPNGRLDVRVRVVHLLHISMHHSTSYGVNVAFDVALSSSQLRLVEGLTTVTTL